MNFTILENGAHIGAISVTLAPNPFVNDSAIEWASEIKFSFTEISIPAQNFCARLFFRTASCAVQKKKFGTEIFSRKRDLGERKFVQSVTVLIYENPASRIWRR